MKKVTLLLATCFYASLAFGQLAVFTNGEVSVQNSLSVSDNLSVTGVSTLYKGLILKGINGYSNRGVFDVKSTGVNPSWNPNVVSNPLSLISTQSQRGEYPFINYYNGEYNFRVGYEGSVWTKYGLIQSSDSLCKENITPLPSALNKLISLRGVSFDYKENDNASKNDSLSNQAATLSSNIPMSDIQGQIELEKSRKRIGLIAQDVEKVYPEVVRTQIDGTKGILYSDLVAVLVEGIKELNRQVSTLQDQMVTLHNRIEELESGKMVQLPEQGNSKAYSKLYQEAVLYQNTPNPFNQETEIAYRIPREVSASINIYNLNGVELKSYPLSDTNGSITIAASELAAGIYIYSLIINNREVDSKRMILTH